MAEKIGSAKPANEIRKRNLSENQFSLLAECTNRALTTKRGRILSPWSFKGEISKNILEKKHPYHSLGSTGFKKIYIYLVMTLHIFDKKNCVCSRRNSSGSNLKYENENQLWSNKQAFAKSILQKSVLIAPLTVNRSLLVRHKFSHFLPSDFLPLKGLRNQWANFPNTQMIKKRAKGLLTLVYLFFRKVLEQC